MIKTEQATDDSGVYTLRILASLNCCDKPAVFKDSEITFGFIYFISSKHIVNSISLEELCWLKLPQKCYRLSGIFPPNLV